MTQLVVGCAWSRSAKLRVCFMLQGVERGRGEFVLPPILELRAGALTDESKQRAACGLVCDKQAILVRILVEFS